MPRLLLSMILVSLFLTACSHETDPAYIKEIDQWHAERVERLTVRDGWLTLVGLHPLHEGINTLGSAPDMDIQLGPKAPARVGAVTMGDGLLLLTVTPGVEVRQTEAVDHEPFLSLQLLPDTSGNPTILEVGPLHFFVIERNGLFYLRVKDTESEVLEQFQGVDRFPVDDRWRVTARLEEGPETTAVPNVLGQTIETASPGVLVFKVEKQEYRLTPQGEPGQGLFIVFGDATNGQATYSGGRFLNTDPPLEDGTVILDFNKSTNPPCAFTPFATCPLPSKDNMLDLAITAGEKVWGDHPQGI